MIRSEVTIINKLGLHARAASKFVSCASRYACEVRVGKDGHWVDGKSIMAIMLLAAGKGTVLELELEGADEAQALTAIDGLVTDFFGEGE